MKPTFQHYLDNIKDTKQHQEVRIQLIRDIEKLTKRKLIIYAADPRKAQFASTLIDSTDKAGFSDLIEGIQGNPVDVLIHSTGGFAEATEELVKLLRASFDDIRFIVPHSAMSATTMMCLSGNWILMDERSSLGPIDPQIQLPSQQGLISVPAQVIIDGFEKAKDAVAADPNALPAFLPWLSQYVVFVPICQDAKNLSESLAKEWMRTYMFRSEPDKEDRADRITAYLLNRGTHKSHNRGIGITEAKKEGLNILDLREQPEVRNSVWSLYCCIELFFDRSAHFKLFENAYGVSWGRQIQQVAVRLPPAGVPTPPQPPEKPPSSST